MPTGERNGAEPARMANVEVQVRRLLAMLPDRKSRLVALIANNVNFTWRAGESAGDHHLRHRVFFDEAFAVGGQGLLAFRRVENVRRGQRGGGNFIRGGDAEPDKKLVVARHTGRRTAREARTVTSTFACSPRSSSAHAAMWPVWVGGWTTVATKRSKHACREIDSGDPASSALGIGRALFAVFAKRFICATPSIPFPAGLDSTPVA
jgi:hypothetical protein